MSKRGAADEEGPEIPAETDFPEFFEPWPRVQAASPRKRLKVCVFRPKHGNDCIIYASMMKRAIRNHWDVLWRD